MEVKKSPKADLEGKKSTWLLIGYVFILALMFVAFEWTERDKQVTTDTGMAAVVFEEEMVPITEQEEQQQAPPPEVPKAEEIIEIVENDAKVEETVIQASDDTEKAVEVKYTPVVVEEEEPEQQIFQIVEEMPEFPGGMGECLKFLMKNAKYPTISQENGVQGKVSVKFVIEKDGSITDAKVVRTDNPVFNEEALRVVNSMPKWKPGKQRGKEVRVSYTVPVIFSLDGKGYQKAMSTAKGNTKSNATQAQSGSDFDENQLFQIVEEMPEFPGGMGACLKFLMANTEYPEKAKAQKVEGKVSVKFVVEKDGSISNPQIIKGGNPLLNDEALRVVNSMPKWKPGKQRGKVVRVGYTVPIIFKLQ